jgi:hypothetical protein
MHKGQGDVAKGCIRARDCSSSFFNALYSRSHALRYSVSLNMARPSSSLRSLGCSVMNEQLISFCDVETRLNAAVNRAREVFGHVPAPCKDPLSRIWQLLSLCCLPQQERIAALSPSASIFSLLELLQLRLNSPNLFCRYCVAVASVCSSHLIPLYYQVVLYVCLQLFGFLCRLVSKCCFYVYKPRKSRL